MEEVIYVAESLSVPLGEQEHLKEFFEVMRDNGKKIQAEDMERLFGYITVLQRDLKDAIEEVDYLRDQIEEMQDQTLKAKFENIQWAVQDSMHNAWDQIKEVKEAFTAQILNGAAVCKRKGVQALDRVLDMTHILYHPGGIKPIGSPFKQIGGSYEPAAGKSGAGCRGTA